MEALQDVFAKTSKEHAPWYIIPSNHKWFRNLAVSQIVAETMEEMDLKMPEATVDLEVIRRKYHEAAEQMPARSKNKRGESTKKR